LVNLEVAIRLDTDKSYGISWYNRRRVTKRQVPEVGTEGRRYRRVQKTSEKPRGEWIAVPVPDSGVSRSLVDLARDRIKDNISPKKAPASSGRLLGASSTVAVAADDWTTREHVRASATVTITISGVVLATGTALSPVRCEGCAARMRSRPRCGKLSQD
jgi:hypothetical protein